MKSQIDLFPIDIEHLYNKCTVGPRKKEVKSSSNLFWDNIAPPFQVPYREINVPLIFSVLDVSNVQRE